MKKGILLVFIAACTLQGFSQSEKFIGAMKKNIAMIDSAFTAPAMFTDLSNTFERIGNSEKSQWLPYYYAAYCRVYFALMQKDPSGNDEIANKAAELIAKADSLQPNNSEISLIKSLIATAHMVVNPMVRYGEYGQLVNKELQNAMTQDPTNPRPYLVKGQNLRFTPENFGGGCKTALPELEKAAKLFADFKPASEIHPSWGLTYTEILLAQCR